MKFKREIMAIILIICMLFTISAISATDSTTDALSVTNESVEAASEDVANDNNLAMENDVELLGETDDGSFTALNTKISGASEGQTVYLWNDYEYSILDSITGGIEITKNMTIDGQGHTIDAKGNTRIFKIDSSDNLDITLMNLVIKNGKAGWGGAIYWAPEGGNGNIINCTFINNIATGSYGGAAIYEYKGISNIVNSTFIDNHASSCALYLSSTKVINSVFLNNGETTLYGGYIEADYKYYG